MEKDMEHAAEFLERLPVFAELNDPSLVDQLAKHFKRSTHHKGYVLAREGEPQSGASCFGRHTRCSFGMSGLTCLASQPCS